MGGVGVGQGLHHVEPAAQHGHVQAARHQGFSDGRAYALAAAGDEGVPRAAHLADAAAAAMAFSRAKMDSIWPLAERYCLGQLTGV
mgnify:CR=1 FL=1